MKFKIPYTRSNTDILIKKSDSFAKLIRTNKKTFSGLAQNLKNADAGINKDHYIAISVKTFIISFVFLSVFFAIFFFLIGLKNFFIYGPCIAILISGLLLFTQLNYPRLFCNKKTKDLERNLISAMQDMMVQLNSGVPLFEIINNIAASDYGAVSDEFEKAVKEINSGKPQIEAIDEIGNRSSSLYFRRVVWQMSNGMRAGSDMSVVIKEGIDNLAREQSIQIQGYGSKLNPLIMFYMLFAVILPSLGITFLTILASMLNLSGSVIKLIFFGVFAFVVLLQVFFLGIIRSRRPSLI